MNEYVVTVRTDRALPTMDELLVAIEVRLRELGYRNGEWEAEVRGPPELRIGLVMR